MLHRRAAFGAGADLGRNRRLHRLLDGGDRLLRELDGEYFQSIYQYIQNLPAEQKANSDTYRARLSLCRTCDHLVNGMCDLCGCFVEVRAAKKLQRCPDTPARWQPES